MENARGYYGLLLDPIREQIPEDIRDVLGMISELGLPPPVDEAVGVLSSPGSVLPANINPDVWRAAGLTRESAYEPGSNIAAAADVLRGLLDRTLQPTPAKIGSLWHFTGREEIDHFGKLVGEAYDAKPWLRPREITKPARVPRLRQR